MKKGLLFLMIGLLSLSILTGCGNSSSDQADGDIQTVKIEATDWKFTPDNVTVKPGKVKFVIENKGTRQHGFSIDELGINENIAPGKTVEKVVTVDKPAEYTYYCSFVCGTLEQHDAMKGKITIKE